MSNWIDRLGHTFTDAIPGAIFDLVFGRGGDGVPHSSAESYYRPEEAQNPEIHIHADNVNIAQAAHDIEQAQVERDHNTEAQFAATVAAEQRAADRQAQEAAYYEALQQEQAQGRSY